MKRLTLLSLLVCSSLILRAQDGEDLGKRIADMLETLAEQQILDADYDEMINDLIKLNRSPIDLNTADKDELEQLFFLTDFQVENILFYRYQNGPMYSVYELQAVEKLDQTTIDNMLPFVTVRAIDEKQTWSSTGQVLARIQNVLQTPQGYKAKNDTTPPVYLGSKEKWMTRGRFDLGNKIEMGFTLEKDQGEMAFSQQVPLADFNSAFLQIKKPCKGIDRLIIGDYRLSFGQGLGLWTDMAFGKSTETAQLRRRPKGINPYTSVNESSFLRGCAVRFEWHNWTMSPFVSYKKRDASYVFDSNQLMNITGLPESGFHRTAGELAKRFAAKERVYGLQLDYRQHMFHIEGGFVNWTIDKPLAAPDHPKDIYRFNGDTQRSMWLAYSVFLNKVTFFGEQAVQNHKHWGLFHGLSYNAGNDILLSLAYRNYSNAYAAILSNPFSESSTPGGESGVFASLQFKPGSKLLFKAFVDIFSYKWLRYSIYRPSSGFESFAQLNYAMNGYNTFYLRYKNTQKEINSGEQQASYQINAFQKDNLRIFYTYKPSDKWRLQTQVEQTYYQEEKHNSKGWLAYQDVKYRASKAFVLAVRYVLFDIDEYNSRIYNYEPDVLYAFTIPSYMNRGSRILFNVNFKPLKNLRLWARLAHTNYRGLQHMGSGNQQIDGNRLTEVKFQVQYRF